ncbi:MAG: hypothetical protein AAFP69_19670, partial [Planctomycetota bacterium]
ANELRHFGCCAAAAASILWVFPKPADCDGLQASRWSRSNLLKSCWKLHFFSNRRKKLHIQFSTSDSATNLGG